MLMDIDEISKTARAFITSHGGYAGVSIVCLLVELIF